MGNFFTSTQIYNPEKLDKESFKNCFCEKMKKEGYELCDSDSAELSYILAFSDCNKWVAITSEAYEEGNKFAHDDAGRISKMMKTTCINTTVIDSDCAVLELYNKSGKKSDSLIMGRVDECFGKKVSRLSRDAWKPFLSDASSLKELCKVVENSEDYTFIEDGLSELASVIGMDKNNIMLSAEDAEESEQIVFLNFKKAEIKKEKKTSLNAVFISIFGETLEALGFVRIKSKHPYYIRVVNGEILNIITFDKDGRNEFSVFGGIATLYRKKFDFDQNVINNLNTMNDTAQFYYYSELFEPAKSIFDRSYSILPNDNNSIKESFLKALSHTKRYIIPVMDSIVSLRDCVNHFMVYQSTILQILLDEEDLSGSNEGLIYFKIDDHSDMKLEIAKYLKCHQKFTNYDILFNHAEAYRRKQIQNRDEIYNNIERYKEIIAELSLRKETNINRLRQYGLNIVN